MKNIVTRGTRIGEVKKALALSFLLAGTPSVVITNNASDALRTAFATPENNQNFGELIHEHLKSQPNARLSILGTPGISKNEEVDFAQKHFLTLASGLQFAGSGREVAGSGQEVDFQGLYSEQIKSYAHLQFTKKSLIFKENLKMRLCTKNTDLTYKLQAKLTVLPET